MDPMDLEQLLYELSGSPSTDLSILADEMYVGLVLAGGTHDRHVVTRTPTRSAASVTLSLRSVYGGHTFTVRRSRSTRLAVYAQRLHRAHLSRIPAVPRPYVPYDPAAGDRLVYAARHTTHLGVSSRWIFTHDGTAWTREGRPVPEGRVPVEPQRFLSQGTFTYLPARHRAHLYVDGHATPARTAAELEPGDVLLEDGAGRHRVVQVTARGRYSLDVQVEVLDLTRTPLLTQLPAAHAVGSNVVFTSGHDALYPVEPRPGDLRAAWELEQGDVVITSYGATHSAVATVDDAWRTPLRPSMNVALTAVDGRPRTMLTDPDNGFVLLYRPALTVLPVPA
ncbi:hypothetical protein ACFZAM_31745 [Streptomyces sp. NPDC008079]|uniref:hypothetical protein n=1 Tax=Streptomyces sp. NPDC008079 TaxID=3364806 RepID=UPI0036EB36E7